MAGARGAGMTRHTLPDRFWAKVDRRGPNDCWNWTATKSRDGYGHIHTDRLHAEKAHRVSYRLHFGEIPSGMAVMHRCDNPSCVNPSHLELGTLAENNADRNAKGRQAAGERLSLVKRGERHGAAKLSEHDVVAIRERFAAGRVSQDELALEYGVSRTNISAIIVRRSWRHVP